MINYKFNWAEQAPNNSTCMIISQRIQSLGSALMYYWFLTIRAYCSLIIFHKYKGVRYLTMPVNLQHG